MLVCNVPSTKCPVSDALIANEIVSKSRISPTMITSGSSRNAARKALEKLAEFAPISRWETWQPAGLKTYSIGSSSVMMWSFLSRLM